MGAESREARESEARRGARTMVGMADGGNIEWRRVNEEGEKQRK